MEHAVCTHPLCISGGVKCYAEHLGMHHIMAVHQWWSEVLCRASGHAQKLIFQFRVGGIGLVITDTLQDIIALRESLNGMQFYLKQQHNQIMSLKHEMHTLELKTSEGGWSQRESVWSQREEKKLQQFKQEVSTELEALKKRVHSLSVSAAGRGPAGGPSTGKGSAFFSDELFGSKLQRSDVVSSLRSELSSFKSKLAAQGSKFGGVASELREMKHRQDDVTKMASSMEEWRKMEDARNSVKVGVASGQNTQLRRLKDLLSSLERRLEHVEESAFMPTINKSHDSARHTHFKHTPPTPSTSSTLSHDSTRRTHFRTTNPVHSDPMTLTDLNLSPVGVATATKVCLQRNSSLKGKRKKMNPLYEPLTNYQDLLSDSASTLEGCGKGAGSELDGHTLSCSLELMSDFEGSDSYDLNSDLISDTDDTISLSNLIR